ncbi:MAG TPA: tetratricopeptide repeat protein [Geobacteraceae bacterium]
MLIDLVKRLQILNLPSKRTKIFVFSLLNLLVFAIYFQVRNFNFINYDDASLLLHNPNVYAGLTLQGVTWAFTATDFYDWFPLTWLSHMMDFQLYGENPAGHHLTNLILHLLNTSLLLILLSRVTGNFWKSAFVAAMFALHPLHVEPVAWVMSRKDLLSTLFLFLSLMSYFHFAKSRSLLSYAGSLLFFVFSLMSKQMMVTLPALLLLMDFWPLNRWSGSGRKIKALIYEKIPFAIVSIIISGITIYVHSNSHNILTLKQAPLALRLIHIPVSYGTYIFKTIWPEKLAVFYPISKSYSGWEIGASIIAIALITVIAATGVRLRPYLFVGWSWFLLTLLPVIGIVQIGSHTVADRYMYVPIIGLFIFVTWGISDLVGNSRWQKLIPFAAIIVLLACSAKTWWYLGSWQNDITLYTKALEINRKNFVVLNNLGKALNSMGRSDEAAALYYESIQTEPEDEIAYVNLAYYYMVNNNCEMAINLLNEALRLKPDYPEARGALEYCQKKSGARSR